MSEVMTLQEVATYLRVSVHTVRDWRRKGILKVQKLPTGSIRVKRTDMEALLQPQPSAEGRGSATPEEDTKR